MAVLTPSELAVLTELRQRLARDFGLVELKLFGSKARGDSTPESDVDVLIVLESCDRHTRDAIYDLCYDVGMDRGVFLSAAIYSRAQYESPLRRETPFYRSVVREGVVV